VDKKFIVAGYISVLVYLTIMQALNFVGYISYSASIIVTGVITCVLLMDNSKHLKKELEEVMEFKKELNILKDKVANLNLRKL